jgi:hypothetical protein
MPRRTIDLLISAAGLMLAYGFWQFGQEAQLATYVSWIGAAVLFLLVLLGVVHARRSNHRAAV